MCAVYNNEIKCELLRMGRQVEKYPTDGTRLIEIKHTGARGVRSRVRCKER